MVLNTGDTVVEEEPQVAAAGVVETTTGAEGETTEELDYKALYEAELTERTREEETGKARNGRAVRERDGVRANHGHRGDTVPGGCGNSGRAAEIADGRRRGPAARHE